MGSMSEETSLFVDSDLPTPAYFRFVWHVVGALLLTLGVVFSSIFITFLFRADEHVGMVAFLGLFVTPISYLVLVLSMRNEDNQPDETTET